MTGKRRASGWERVHKSSGWSDWERVANGRTLKVGKVEAGRFAWTVTAKRGAGSFHKRGSTKTLRSAKATASRTARSRKK